MFGAAVPAARDRFEYASFPDGGYTAIREWRQGDEILWVMDHGPLGYLSIAAHGHADALSLWLHINGRPVLVDAGTYLYHSGGPWRQYFRSTAAHNTLTMMGQDSSTMAGAFNWLHKARCRLLDQADGVDQWIAEAEHDGYEARFGLRHRRRLERLGTSGVRLTDSLHGKGLDQHVEIGFQVAAGLDITHKAEGWLISENGKPLLLIVHTGGLHGRVEGACESPICNWHSPAFGERVPAQRLLFSGQMGTKAANDFNFITSFKA